MDFEKAIDDVAANYVRQGYEVVARPVPANLPPFAKDFRVQVVGRKGASGVLVAIRKNREEFASDPELDRYAEMTGSQEGWRFDFVLLEGSEAPVEPPQELSGEQFARQMELATQSMRGPDRSSALISAWAVLESSIRSALRAEGQTVGFGTPVRQMLNELVSNGTISIDEHARLYEASMLRNRIVHGFSERTINESEVDFLLNLAKRLHELHDVSQVSS